MAYKVSNKDQRELETLPVNLQEKDTYLAIITKENPTGGGDKKPGITLRFQLYNDDGSKVAPLNGNQDSVETTSWMPLSGNRFNQYVGAIFPELDEAGGEFDDGDMLGRTVILKLKMREHKNEQDAKRFGAQIEVDHLECVPSSMAAIARQVTLDATGDEPKTLLKTAPAKPAPAPAKPAAAKPAAAKPASAAAKSAPAKSAPSKPAQTPVAATAEVDPNDPFGVGAQ